MSASTTQALAPTVANWGRLVDALRREPAPVRAVYTVRAQTHDGRLERVLSSCVSDQAGRVIVSVPGASGRAMRGHWEAVDRATRDKLAVVGVRLGWAGRGPLIPRDGTEAQEPDGHDQKSHEEQLRHHGLCQLGSHTGVAVLICEVPLLDALP